MMTRALLLVPITLLLLACAALAAPIAALRGTPTPSPSSTPTMTLSPTASPSSTPEPTETPTLSPTATPAPTLEPTIAILYTAPPPIAPTSSEWSCKFNWQSPGNGINYEPFEEFTVGWNVTNTGSASWNPDSVEFTYMGGAKMYDYPVVRLKASVAPGEAVVISVHMQAPSNSTLYTTHWSLRKGNYFFCPLTVSIYVE